MCQTPDQLVSQQNPAQDTGMGGTSPGPLQTHGWGRIAAIPLGLGVMGWGLQRPPPPASCSASSWARGPARGASHLCHTVTIILHKIIIKNPNFSASNPASGLLASPRAESEA